MLGLEPRLEGSVLGAPVLGGGLGATSCSSDGEAVSAEPHHAGLRQGPHTHPAIQQLRC